MRFVFFILSLIVLLIVGALVGPSFVDWNKYKPQIITQVKSATGLDVKVDGDMSLAILPSPRVKIENVVVAAPLKKKFDNILSMKSAEVSVELIPLIRKEVKVQSVTLIAPDIQIEIMEDGRPSWTTEKLSSAKKVTDVAEDVVDEDVVVNAKNKFMDSVALDKLEIEDGKLTFINHQTGVTQSAEDVDVVLNANSLNGPFKIDGAMIYDGKKIAVKGSTGKMPKNNEGLNVQAVVSLPDADTTLDFKGVAAIAEPYEVQGQTKLNIGSPSKLKEVTGVSLGGFNKSIGVDGLLSANQDKIAFDNLKLALGDFIGDGKITVQNLKSKNPLTISGNIKSASVLNLDDFIPKNKKTASLNIGITNPAYAAESKSFVPQTLTLPMPITAEMKFDLGGVKVQNQVVKGVFLDVNKNAKVTKATFKALELPGQAKAEGDLNISYASSSLSSKTGQVTYSDPSVTYAVNGQVGQLANFLKSFAPDADASAVTNLYKTAQFNLKGAVSGNAVSLKDSVLKLDDMVVGLGGNYQVPAAGGRAKAKIDISADSVDVDRIMSAQGKKGTSSKSSAPKSTKEALEPVQNFSLPLDLDFDISLQKARINDFDISGVRLVGGVVGQSLNLSTASINSVAGATVSAKGKVGNISNLSGIDLSLYTKTSNISELAKALKVDISKLPAGLKALETNVTGKGSADKLNFTSNIKALGGQLEANGIANNLLGEPSFNNLAIGLKHSNLVKAIQIVNPSFKGQSGLSQPIDFYAKADINGKQYNLSDMKVALGNTTFGGDLKINAGNNPVSVRGNIAAGKIALDALLGAKTAQNKAGYPNVSSYAANDNARSSGPFADVQRYLDVTTVATGSSRWSTAPIDLSFMKALDVDVDLSASSITYGVWNLTKPSTDLKIANGKMVIKGMKAGVFGGQANLSTEVNASPLSLTLSSNMDGIDLNSLTKALSGSSKLQTAGTVNFDMNVNSAGSSANALINALNGKADLNGTDVTIKGFDLVKLARGLATDEKLAVSALNLVTGALQGGQTKFDTLKGDYKIEKGKVNITSMALDNADSKIASSGYADLPSWFINVDNLITLKNVTDLKPFEIKIKGSLNNPTTLGKNILEDYVADKVKRKLNKELADKLPDVLGDDVTDKLKKFGVVGEDGGLDSKQLNPQNLINNLLKPKDEKVEPVKEPVPVKEVAPTTPVKEEAKPAVVEPKVEPAPAPAPAPAPEPKKIEKPQDALDTILNNQGSPEEAVNDLIKGLF